VDDAEVKAALSAETAMLSDTARVETFSDAVFAIVITLLILDLRVPETAPGHLWSGILALWPNYLAYVTSFLAVGVIWLNHHAVFRRIRWMDRNLHWINFGILFTTALLPFPTSVVAHAVRVGNRMDDQVAIGLYAFLGCLMCVSWVALFQYLSRRPHLIDTGVDTTFLAQERRRFAIGIGLYLLAGVFGYLLPSPVALVAFVVLPITYGMTSHRLDELPSRQRRAVLRRQGESSPLRPKRKKSSGQVPGPER
jgi:uncharacterized membrane protein